ncbi:hypothetical protein P9E76_11825 [Schinkia azotoformans]|uniref:Uncharacterized protein n=1 Tax=Schinkia azotoformans LMG 9581 TaxID=1131731 RepID=K6CR86_SCHAZ|nr:hypothetical protein [Schinkia azotoformans]EKN62767.1 hypothetical protein BAZO_20158 [Schinkia azotoformans LMG 9581]MEC1639143.1 hypothetical protein [Schinkia azotoformans]MEC1945731.1 hypothetical protein [Schinkia azotoformans]
MLSVMGVTEHAQKEACEVNRLELGGNYRVHLIVESKVHTSTAFKEFLLAFGNKICPVDGEISYVNGKVECSVHSVSAEDSNDGDDGEVPYL